MPNIKIREFLRGIIDPMKLNNQEVETVLQSSALGELEVPDTVNTKFNEFYLTPDRAAADEKILSKARKAAYSFVANKLFTGLLPKLKEEDQRAINDAAELFDKIALYEKAIDNLIAHPDDVKKIEEKWRKTEGELRGQLKALEDAAKKTEENKKSELEGLKMDYAIRVKLGGVELAPEFADDENKEFLANSNIDFLKKNFILQFDEKNPNIIHLRKNVEGAIVDVYDYKGKPKADKTAYTLDDVIADRYDRWKKKNNGGAGDKSKDQQQQPPRQKSPSDKPLTLSEMHRQAAADRAA